MTGLLKEVLSDQVERADLDTADLAGAIAAGQSRLRRRRFGQGAAAVAAVAALALTVPALQHVTGSEDRGSNATQPQQVAVQGDFAERKPTYATGSDIHYGDQTISVAPHKVHAFVQVVNGFGFVNVDGEVYFTDGNDVTKIGTAGAEYGELIASDEDGSILAWADLSATGRATFRAYDTDSLATSEVVGPATKSGEFDVPLVTAVDGSDIYILDSDGAKRWNLKTATVDVLKAGVSDQWLEDAENGWLAFNNERETVVGEDPDAGEWQDVVIAKDPRATGPRYPSGRVVFSPEATYFANDHDDSEQILTREGGRDVTPDLAGYEFMAVMQWIDDDSFVAVGFADEESSTFDLLRCSVEDGLCETTVEGLTAQEVELPFGESIKDR